MKKLLMLAIACLALHVGFAQDKKTKTPKGKMDTTVMHKLYTCSMHPDVLSDKPGKCPKCGMTLVEKKMPAKGKMKKDTAAMKM